MDQLTARRDEAQQEVAFYAERARKKSKHRNFYLEQMRFEERIFHIINDKLPERYQKKLVIPRIGGPAAEDEQEKAA